MFWRWQRNKKIVSRNSILKRVIEKPRIKHLKNIYLLHEIPFHDELSISKISQVFKRYARSYRIEIIDSKDPSVQLTASK